VKGSAGVMALVLAQVMAGGLAFLWLTPVWGEVKRGFFKLNGVLYAVFALGAWASARAGALPGNSSGTWAVRLTLATLVLVALFTVLLFVRQPGAARVVGLLSVLVAIATLVEMAPLSRQGSVLGFLQLAAGAAFLGAVVDGLMLGHWYLTDRGLSRTPINRYATILLGAVVLEAAAVISGGFSGTGSSQSFNPLLTAGGLAPWIALGMAGTTLLIGVMVKAALRGARGSAVQSATGFYYLAVVTAFTAEVAVKTRFFDR
jgi:tryptophan-rich sensory protein